MSNASKSILIIDDDVGILTACAESLMLDGYQVDVAESGEKAVEMIPKKKYHLVVTDLMMGEMDGLQVLKFAKEFSPFSEVVMLTAHGSVDSAVEAMKMGAYDYLSKPFDPYRLDTAVKRALEHQNLLREISGLREILRLYDATKILSGIRDEKELLQAMAKYACEISDAEGSVIHVLAPDRKEFITAAVHGVRHGVLAGKKIPFEKTLVSTMVLEDIKTLDTTALRKYLFMQDVPGYSDISSSLSIPILYQDRVMAVISLCRTGNQKPSFSEEELRLLTIFTAQAGHVIENTRLFNALGQQSSYDAIGQLLQACQNLVVRPGFQNLPLNEKTMLEELMAQCRALIEKHRGGNGASHPARQ